MPAADSGRAKSIFIDAIENYQPDQWPTFLDEACGDDCQLRARVDDLLNAHKSLDSIPRATGSSTDDFENPDARIGVEIGPYKLLQVIGEGGFGVVYMAEQLQPVNRRVAIKIIKPGMDSREVIARFEAERQALAMMDHPNISRVLDAGATESGSPYFVMELVRGVSITTYCDQNHLSLRYRLELFATVCLAVQHAHQKGIIHRDIKPSNIMITLHDGKPVVKIIDFGIAKAINQKLTDKTLFTKYADMIGTPLYMSPEQAELSGLDIDTRADIYSLAVLLYELLTGTTPFDGKRLRDAAYDEVRRIIREEDPPKPSTKVSTLGEAGSVAAGNCQMESKRLIDSLRGDLDWIVMKGLEKDRSRRYESAIDLAKDIGRYLSDEPVEACPPSKVYLFHKFARRNRTVMATVAVIVVTLLLGAVLSTWQAVRATRASQDAAASEQRADLEATRARSAAESEKALRINSDLLRAEATDARKAANNQAESSRQQLVAMNVDTANRLMSDGRSSDGLPFLVEALRLDGSDPKRERIHRLRLAAHLATTPRPVQVWHAGESTGGIALSSDGERLLTWNGDGNFRVDGAGSAKIWEIANGALLAKLACPSNVSHAAFTSDGRFVVTASADKLVRLWNAVTGESVGSPMPHDLPITSIDISTKDHQLVTGASGPSGIISFWKLPECTLNRSLPFGSQPNVAYSPDGKYVLADNRVMVDGEVRIWEAETGKQLASHAANASVYQAHWVPPGREVAISSGDHTILWDWGADTTRNIAGSMHRYSKPTANHLAFFTSAREVTLWDTNRQRAAERILEHELPFIHFISFSSNGRYALTGAGDHTARVWDTRSGKAVTSPLWHSDGLYRGLFTPEGRRLVTLDQGGMIRLWDLATGVLESTVLRVGSNATLWTSQRAAISHDRRYVALTGKPVCIWDLDSGKPSSPPLCRGQVVEHVVFSPNDRVLAVVGTSVSLWSVPDGNLIRTLAGVDSMQRYASFSPDGQTLAVASAAGYARLYDVLTGRPIGRRLRHAQAVSFVGFSPSGQHVVTTSGTVNSGDARVWNAKTGEPVSKSLAHDRGVVWADFNRDESRIVTATLNHRADDCSARIWDIRLGKPIGEPMRHEDGVFEAFFDGTDQRIVTVSEDGTARIWDASSGRPLTPPMRHQHHVYSCQLSSDGLLLATCSRDYTVRIWDTQTGAAIGPPRWHDHWVRNVFFDSQSDDLISVTMGGDVHRWPIKQEGRDLTTLQRLAGVLAGRSLDEFGSTAPLTLEAYTSNWQSLRADSPDEFQANDQAIFAWRQQEAYSAFRQEEWRTCVEHINRASVETPVGHLAMLRGKAHFRLGNWELAVKDLSTALESSPDDPEILLHRAQAFAGSDSGDAALADYRRAIDQLSDWSIGGLIRDNTTNWLTIETFSDAIKYFSEARQKRPDNPDSWYCLARSAAMDRRHSDAAELFSKCIELDSRDWQAQAMRASMTAHSDPRRAIKDATFALNNGADPQYSFLYRIRGNAAASLGRWSDALVDYRRLLELEPQDNFVWYRMATLLVQTGQIEECNSHVATAIQEFQDGDREAAGRVSLPLMLLPDAAVEWQVLAEQLRNDADAKIWPSDRRAASGIFEYRAGNFEKSRRLLEANVDALDDRAKVRALAVLAMTNYRLDRHEQAKAALATCQELLDKKQQTVAIQGWGRSWNNWLMGQLLLKEAKSLIEGID